MMTRMMTRMGIGFDVHRFAPGRRLVLGGVEIPSDRGLDGHSDADVLCHAVMDALLGAAALGDIGKLFPNTDGAWKDADSLGLMTRVRERLAANGWRIVNVDSTVVAEFPKVAPHSGQMRERMARALGLSVEAVSIKATTAERMGAMGREEGIAVMAVAAIESLNDEPAGAPGPGDA